jgi:hypothetical protein
MTLGRPAVQYAGPPADRMAGRPSRTAKASGAATATRAHAYLDRESLLDEAVNRGVIGANLRGHYAACFDADPHGTRSYLHGIGLAAAPAGATHDAPSEEYVDTHLSPQERQGIAAAREGKRSRVIKGGL